MTEDKRARAPEERDAKSPGGAREEARDPRADEAASDSAVGIFRLTVRGKLVSMNRRAFEISGVSHDDAMDGGWQRFVSPEDIAQMRGPVRRAIREIRPYCSEFRFLRPGGEAIWAELNIQPERDDEGTLQGFDGTVTDIGDRKRVEQALRDSERRYQDLADVAPIGIFSSSRKELVYLNQRGHDFAGVTLEESRSGEWLNALHPEDRERTLAARLTAIKTGVPWRTECRFVHKDGSVRWILCDAIPQNDSNGEFQGFVGTLTDITERRAMEQALRESEARYQSLVEASPIGVYRNDADGGCVYVNQQLCDILGRSVEESMGAGWVEAVHPDDRAEVFESGRRAFESREPTQLEYRVRRKDGTTRWVVAHMAPANDASGDFVGIVGTVTDITPRKQTEEELARYREKLEELVQERTAELERSQRALMQKERLASLGTFAAGIAHQINNPAGMILLTAQHALDNAENSSVLESDLRDIVDDARRCGRITRSVLEYARGSSTQGVATDLNALVEDSVDLLRRTAAERNSILEVESDPALPRIVLHRAAFEQVLTNVIENALFAGAKRVVLRIEAAPDEIHLTIEDDGTGISEADLPNVLDPFYSTRPDDGGTGLGLALAHGILNSQGGSLEVQSELDHGTVVKIRLPIALGPA